MFNSANTEFSNGKKLACTYKFLKIIQSETNERSGMSLTINQIFVMLPGYDKQFADLFKEDTFNNRLEQIKQLYSIAENTADKLELNEQQTTFLIKCTVEMKDEGMPDKIVSFYCQNKAQENPNFDLNCLGSNSEQQVVDVNGDSF